MATFVGIQTGEKVEEKITVLKGTAILVPGNTSITILIPTNIQAPSGRELKTTWETKLNEESEPGVLPPPPDVPLHAPTHARAGADEIDGDTVDIDFTPTDYTPSTTPAEVTDVEELSAHLAGIDRAIADNKMRSWYY